MNIYYSVIFIRFKFPFLIPCFVWRLEKDFQNLKNKNSQSKDEFFKFNNASNVLKYSFFEKK